MTSPNLSYQSVYNYILELFEPYLVNLDPPPDPKNIRVYEHLDRHGGLNSVLFFTQELDELLGNPYSLYYRLVNQDVDELTRTIIEIYHDYFNPD